MSYDAKFSRKSYDFGVEEQRQMFDYVQTLGKSKWLQTQFNRYDGHVIITNSMEESSMKNAADYLCTSHRLSKDRPDFLIVFMRESFLTKLYDLVLKKSDDIIKRWSMFSGVVIDKIKSSNRGGYILLDEEDAEQIVDYLVDLPAVDTPLNLEMLLKDVKHLISQRTNAPTPIPKPAVN